MDKNIESVLRLRKEAKEEFELKFLDVDVSSLERKLKEIGAEKVSEFMYMITIFNFPDHDGRDEWIRVRTDGTETTVTRKKINREVLPNGESKITGVEEDEARVADYEKVCADLIAQGFIKDKVESKRRVRHKKAGVEFDIDTWPGIPTYLEIESTSYEKVKAAAQELGFDPAAGIIGSAGTVYRKYGINVEEYSQITFDGLVKK